MMWKENAVTCDYIFINVHINNIHILINIGNSLGPYIHMSEAYGHMLSHML